jgi:hypothetical protein
MRKRQKNKPHKSGSKKNIGRELKSVVEKKRITASLKLQNAKNERKNKTKQKIQTNRDILISKNRCYGEHGISKLMIFIEMNEEANSLKAIEFLIDGNIIILGKFPICYGCLITTYSRMFKQFFSFLAIPSTAITSFIDSLIVADFVCFVSNYSSNINDNSRLSINDIINDEGLTLLKVASSIGLPTPFLFVQNMNRIYGSQLKRT